VGRAADFGERHGVPFQLGSYEELAEHAEIDAVYIATPHRFHFDQAAMCLRSGKHVLCEKSITVNARECRQLIELSRRNDRFLMEALWTRFLPIYKQVRTWLDADAIGVPMLLDSTFCFPISDDRPDRLWRHDLAGGALLDIGIYNIAMSQWVLQRNPKDVIVSGDVSDARIDERISAILTYDPERTGGKSPVSQFTCGFHSDGGNDFRISGPKGTIRIHRRFWGATTATLQRDEDPELTIEAPHKFNGFEYQIEEVMQCIGRGEIECAAMSHADSLANMILMDEIRKQIGLRYDFE
jgi:predicted dehydrogenase